MAVLSCKRKVGTQRGPVQRNDGGRAYYDTYVVRTSKAADNGATVLTANGLPKYGDPYSGYPLARVTELDPRRVEDQKTVWEVTVAWTHTPQQRTQTKDLTAEDVERTPPRRSWSTVTYQIHPLADLDGKAYVNTVGDPFEQPPERVKYNRVLTIEELRLAWDEVTASTYLGAVNSDALTVDSKTYPPRTARMVQVDGTQDYLKTGQPYWRVTFSIEFDADGWIPTKVLNQGPRYNARKEIIDAALAAGTTPPGYGGQGRLPRVMPAMNRDTNGVLTGRNALLAMDGTLLADGAQPVWLEFRDYAEMPFRRLNLPLTP